MEGERNTDGPSGRDNLPQLVRRAQAGDRQAFEEIYRRTAQAQFYLMAAKVGAEGAADLLQEMYLVAWRNIGSIEPGSLLGYLNATGRNLCRRYLERRGALTYGTPLDDGSLERRSTEERGRLNSDAIADRDSNQNPGSIVAAEDERRRLERALREELTDFERECVVLRYYQRMKLDEIAAALDSSRSTVKRTLARALATLRSKMGLLPLGLLLGSGGSLRRIVEGRPAPDLAGTARHSAARPRTRGSAANKAVAAATACVIVGGMAVGAAAPPRTEAEQQPRPEAAASTPADGDAPVLADLAVHGNLTVMRFTDETGVADSWCEDGEGNIYRAVDIQGEHKAGTSSWTFALPSGTFYAHAVDEHGNECAGEITVDIVEESPAYPGDLLVSSE